MTKLLCAIGLLLLSCGVVEAAEFQTLASTELGKVNIEVGGSIHVVSEKNGCMKYIKDGETVVRETCRTPKQVVIPYADFLVILSKVEHSEKLKNREMAENGVLVKLNDEHKTIIKIQADQIQACEAIVKSQEQLGETQEKISQAVEQKLTELTGELTREKRLSRYKSEAFWFGVIAVGLWMIN